MCHWESPLSLLPLPALSTFHFLLILTVEHEGRVDASFSGLSCHVYSPAPHYFRSSQGQVLFCSALLPAVHLCGTQGSKWLWDPPCHLGET